MNSVFRPRLHYIVEWAEHHHLKQADIVRELDVDKGTVSRWFAGDIPSEKNLIALAALLGDREPTDLFRHPDNDWLARFLKGKKQEEVERIKTALEAMFPPRAA